MLQLGVDYTIFELIIHFIFKNTD